MNIFVLDLNPVKAAQFQCNKHVVKQIVESYQMLGSALRKNGAQDFQMPLTKSGTPLKGGYPNHPCTVWVSTSRENYKWTLEHALGLCKEYTYRYGKTHFCERGINQMCELSDIISDGGRTEFIQAMPDEFRNSCVVTAYRNYYNFNKRYNISCEWVKRPEPFWWSKKDQRSS